MNAFKLVFLAIACFKVVVRGVKIGEAIVFLVELPYLMITYLLNITGQLTCSTLTSSSKCDE